MKFESLVFAVLIGCASFLPIFTHAQTAEAIPSFDARISVQEDATIEVTERIEYDFGDAEKHGIYRNIPYSYQAGTETYTADVSSVLVTDDVGNPQPFSESRGNGELQLKIGDPETFVTGKQVYVISYIVEGPFLYFDEFDEFYWNVTGFWERPIAKASVLLDLPIGAQILSASCYKGEDGSNTKCDSDEKLVNIERAGYTARAENLKEKEGLTVAVAFPKGVISVTGGTQKNNIPLKPLDFWPLTIPLFVLIFMLRLWWLQGRDPEGRGTIVTEFTPPKGLLPSLAGVVLNETMQGKELSAEIVRLAIEGYLTIHRFEKKVLLFTITDYLIERMGDKVPEDAIGAEILEKLFQTAFIGEEEIQGAMKKGVILSKMKHKFVDEKNAIDEMVYKEVVEQKFFGARPDKVRLKYSLSGFLGGILALGLSIFLNSIIFGVALFISGIIVAVFGFVMPVKTQEGVRMKEYLEGFKRYLKVAEKDRIDFHASPDQNKSEPTKTIDLFTACLPYAMVFGVEDAWAEKFQDIYLEEPTWYHGGQGHAFAAGAFASDLSAFASDMSTASAPQSSGAGGGGSSGGGFGGGGGGSW